MSHKRFDGRAVDELRPLKIVNNWQEHAEGSAMISFGKTKVLCAASVEEGSPSFIQDENAGWLTAEYAMLPRSTHTRNRRNPGGRGKEIQRLIGRSLRAAVDLSKLGPRTITVDCDVMLADGGTRTASITGGLLALAIAIDGQHKAGNCPSLGELIREPMAAISVGIVDGVPVLDLPYEEDSTAEVDMNIVMSESGNLIEVQGTAERDTFSRAQLNSLLDLAEKGVKELCQAQRTALDELGVRW